MEEAQVVAGLEEQHKPLGLVVLGYCHEHLLIPPRAHLVEALVPFQKVWVPSGMEKGLEQTTAWKEEWRSLEMALCRWPLSWTGGYLL